MSMLDHETIKAQVLAHPYLKPTFEAEVDEMGDALPETLDRIDCEVADEDGDKCHRAWHERKTDSRVHVHTVERDGKRVISHLWVTERGYGS